MRPAYVAVAVALAAVPAPRGPVDPVPLLLRSGDLPGLTVEHPAAPIPVVRLAPCATDAATAVPGARAASVILALRDGYVSEAVYVFGSAAAARAQFRAYAAAMAACSRFGRPATVRGEQQLATVTREPYVTRRVYGDESVGYREDALIPGVGPQSNVALTVRTGRVLLLLTMTRGVVPVDDVARAAVERANGPR